VRQTDLEVIEVEVAAVVMKMVRNEDEAGER
jgi:hypothetical protein